MLSLLTKTNLCGIHFNSINQVFVIVHLLPPCRVFFLHILYLGTEVHRQTDTQCMSLAAAHNFLSYSHVTSAGQDLLLVICQPHYRLSTFMLKWIRFPGEFSVVCSQRTYYCCCEKMCLNPKSWLKNFGI